MYSYASAGFRKARKVSDYFLKLFFLVNLQDSFFIEQVNYGSLICE